MDFAEADDYDPLWTRRIAMVFRALSGENDRKISELRHRHLTTMLAAPWLDEDKISSTHSKSVEAFEEILAYYYPGQFGKTTKPERERKEAIESRDSWQKHFGSLNDPEVVRKLEAVRSALLQRVKENQPPDSPLAHQGVFNRDTANHIGSLQTLSR